MTIGENFQAIPGGFSEVIRKLVNFIIINFRNNGNFYGNSIMAYLPYYQLYKNV
jgi:hypothetical protein